jgi:hypothetical protein
MIRLCVPADSAPVLAIVANCASCHDWDGQGYGHITTEEGDVMLKAIGKIAVVAMALCCGSAGVNAQTRSDSSRCHSACNGGFTRCNQVSKMKPQTHPNCAEEFYWCVKSCGGPIR